MAIPVLESLPLPLPEATFLPTGLMRQISRVTRVEGPYIEGEVVVSDRHWVYRDHFPGDPIFPGSLMVEAAGQLVALWAWTRGHRGRPRLVRAGAAFHRPVTPACAILHVEAKVRGKRHLQFADVTLQADGVLVANIEVVLAVLPAEEV